VTKDELGHLLEVEFARLEQLILAAVATVPRGTSPPELPDPQCRCAGCGAGIKHHAGCPEIPPTGCALCYMPVGHAHWCQARPRP